MTQNEFTNLIATITGRIEGRPLDAALETHLNATFPVQGETYCAVVDGCRAGIAAGWMCSREHAGIKYGRVVKPGPATCGFSVDVVEMNNVAGGHHRHPHGEIDMIYGPDTAHVPTVAGGKALVLYLLPEGAIEFTKA